MTDGIYFAAYTAKSWFSLARGVGCDDIGEMIMGKEQPVIIEFKKKVWCDDCGAVTSIPKWMTLKESWCKECQSMKIRLYKPRPVKENQ